MMIEVPPLPPAQELEVHAPLGHLSSEHSVLFWQRALLPLLTARSVLISERHSGTVLYEARADQVVPMASLTKLMTVVVAYELFGPDAQVRVPPAATQIIGAKIPLLEGDVLSVRELTKGAMIRSGNDAAYALAAHHSQGVAGFLKKMNEKAAALGMTGTWFENPEGLDAPWHRSTARDLMLLSRYLLDRHPEIAAFADLEEGTLLGQLRTYPVSTTNLLLRTSTLDIRGLKTGTTDGAGQSLIVYAVLPGGMEVVVVALGSTSRFTEVNHLLWWVWERFTER